MFSPFEASSLDIVVLDRDPGLRFIIHNWSHDLYCPVHPGEGSSSVALLEGSYLFSPWMFFFWVFLLSFFLIRCEVKGQGCRMCTDCKGLRVKCVILDILNKLNWIETHMPSFFQSFYFKFYKLHITRQQQNDITAKQPTIRTIRQGQKNTDINHLPPYWTYYNNFIYIILTTIYLQFLQDTSQTSHTCLPVYSCKVGAAILQEKVKKSSNVKSQHQYQRSFWHVLLFFSVNQWANSPKNINGFPEEKLKHQTICANDERSNNKITPLH